AGGLGGRETDHRPHPLAAHHHGIAHRLGLAIEVRVERKVAEIRLSERAELVRIAHRSPPPPRASRAAAPPRRRDSARPAHRGSRARGPRPPSATAVRAHRASTRAVRAAVRHAQGILESSIQAAFSRTILPKIPFTSFAASSVAYRFASVTASSIATSSGT